MFAQFLLYLKKITYLDVDHGRSWHLHALHNKPNKPEGRVYEERIWHDIHGLVITYFVCYSGQAVWLI